MFRLDRAGTIERLRARARVLLQREDDVLEVRLFGSLARGDAAPGSDADLFIVVADGASPFLERIPRLARYFTGAGIGCDVIAYTRSEAEALRTADAAFGTAIFHEGIVLARRETEPEDRLPAEPT